MNVEKRRGRSEKKWLGVIRVDDGGDRVKWKFRAPVADSK